MTLDGSNIIGVRTVTESPVIRRDSLTRIVYAAKASLALLVNESLITVYSHVPRSGASLVSGFDHRIRLLAASEGVTLVDAYKAFNGDVSLLSTDGLHPNAAGYKRIADTFFQSIKAMLEVSTTLTGLQHQRPIPFDGY